jgi:hypothetical protein
MKKMIEHLRANGFNYAADKFENNANNHNYWRLPFSDLREASATFLWVDTDEGHDFWHYVSCKIDDYSEDEFEFKRYARNHNRNNNYDNI